MNTPDFEPSALTAYALGELNPAEAAQVRRAIAASPEVRAEYARIEQTVAAMRQAPAIPRRALTQRQRETVLSVGQAPSRGSKVIPFSQARVRTQGAFSGVLKFAAAACVVFGAFVLGQKHTQHTDAGIAVTDAANETTAPAKDGPLAPQVASTSTPEAPAKHDLTVPDADAATFEPVQQPPRVASVLVADTTPATVLVPALAEPAPVTVPVASRPAASSLPTGQLKSFTVASAQPESMIVLQPQRLRVAAKPVPREFAGQLLAAPVQEKPKAAPRNAPPKKLEKQPQLEIHSWKAEIAACPWDASRRLMRFVAQIPVDQEGIESNARDYQISVKFDPAQVQAWRLITEKHMPPTNGGQMATRFAWYEIVPGRNFAPKTGKPAVLGALEIIQPRGVAHDIQPLKVRPPAGEDFIFETAMVGFNLLLQGKEDIGSLNHKLVLDLAEQSSDDDPRGERGKFISAVKQAQRAAGL